MKCNYAQKWTAYEVISDSKKGGRVAKSLFLEKSVQKLLNKKIKTEFFQKVPRF